MKLQHYEFLCVLIAVILGHEFLVLNNVIHAPSILRFIFIKMHYKDYNLNPTAGYPISYVLGWAGFIVMLMTNPYIIKKRFPFGFFKWGKMGGWLDFHIFCGMLGPVLIVYHSNFKVSGLVSISFWSMIIASSSGIVGRYFYVQTLRKREDLVMKIDKYKKFFQKAYNELIPEPQIEIFLNDVAHFAGAIEEDKNPLLVLAHTMRGDFNLYFRKIHTDLSVSDMELKRLKHYGKNRRRLIYIEPFNKLVGYWHSFHLPFAIFMYIVAVIHIAAALLLGVKH